MAPTATVDCRRRLTAEERETILRLYAEGWSASRAAQAVNATHTTAVRLLRREGIKLRPRSAYKWFPNPVFTPEQEAEICRLYVEEFLSAQKISERYYCSSSTIQEVLKRREIPRRTSREYAGRLKQPSALTEEQVADICRYYELGWSSTKLSPIYHVHPSTIVAVLRRQGIRRRPPNERELERFKPEVFEELQEMYWGRQMSIAEIAEIQGLSPGTVSNRMKRGGIPRRSRSESAKLCYEQGRRPQGFGGVKAATSSEAQDESSPMSQAA